MPKNRTAFGLVRVLKLTAILWLQKTTANWSGAAAFAAAPLYIISATVFRCSVIHNKQATYRALNAIFGKFGRAASPEVMIQLFNSKCLSILYYGIDVCPLTSTQINSLPFIVNNKYRVVNDNNIVCQACVRRWLPVHYCYWLVKFSLFLLPIVYHLW